MPEESVLFSLAKAIVFLNSHYNFMLKAYAGCAGVLSSLALARPICGIGDFRDTIRQGW
jgi:hypothetical protein